MESKAWAELLDAAKAAEAELSSIIKARVQRGEQQGGGTPTDFIWERLHDAIENVCAQLAPKK